MTGRPLEFVKGHGTENDFVLLPDRDGELELTEVLTRLLCDRRAGIGGDGVIRVGPSPDGGWLMDYRNADGSIAEMCGNGARVFARFLVSAGWEQPGRFDFSTRAGRCTAELGRTGDVGITMGTVRIGGQSSARVGGRRLPGTVVDVGNPHLVCPFDGDLAELDLTRAPEFDPELFPHGVNVEFVGAVGPDHVAMRVFERGVGETRSCGTGTVAVAAVQLRSSGRAAGAVTVDVPGGRVVVHITATTVATAGAATDTGLSAQLVGPAVLVASGVVESELLAG